jgi:hypothetical protein
VDWTHDPELAVDSLMIRHEELGRNLKESSCPVGDGEQRRSRESGGSGGGKGGQLYTLGVGREPSELPSCPFDPGL